MAEAVRTLLLILLLLCADPLFLPHQHFRLLDLPAELIGHIFDYLEDDPAGKRGVCTALLPFARGNLFYYVDLSGPSLVTDFLQLVDARGADNKPLPCVKSFALSVKQLRLHPGYLPLDEECVLRLRKAVKLMRNVQGLSIQNSQVIRKVLGAGAKGGLPNLEDLELHVGQGYSSRLFDPAQLNKLGNFPSLRELRLDIRFNEEDPPVRLSADFSALSGLEKFSLRTRGLPAGPSAVTDLVRHLNALKAFEIEFGEGDDPCHILQALSPDILSLEIQHFDSQSLAEHMSFPWPPQVDKHISRFTKLNSLTLRSNVFSQSSAFYTLLQTHLPLLQSFIIVNAEDFLNGGGNRTTIPFDIDGVTLLSYIRSRGGPSSALRLVELVEPFEFGPSPTPRYGFDEDLDYDEDADRLHWHLADWNDWMSYEQAEELQQVAKGVGIELRGALASACEAERLYVERSSD